MKIGWGKMGVYYRVIHADGAMSALARAGEGKGALTYPAVQLGLSGRIFLGWTETVEGKRKARKPAEAYLKPSFTRKTLRAVT